MGPSPAAEAALLKPDQKMMLPHSGFGSGNKAAGRRKRLLLPLLCLCGGRGAT